jgi:hypothetical protein
MINDSRLLKFISPVLVLISVVTIAPYNSLADIICLKATSKNGAVKFTRRTVASSKRCPRGMTQIVDTSTLVGPQGPAGTSGINGTNGTNGTDGADGSIRIYGNGSGGDVTISSNTALSNVNVQYEDLTINSGITLTVPSGTIIRSNGTVTINGAIAVSNVGSGGNLESSSSNGITYYAITQPSLGNAKRSAGFPEVGSNASDLYGGVGGFPLSEGEARAILRLHPRGCGSGTSSMNGEVGGAGGGSFTILAKNGIIVSDIGSIRAPGASSANGGGGGAGGFVVLASSGSIVNGGLISAIGGDGGASFADSAAGGGGGGGAVHLLAPTISAGIISVAAGARGSSSVPVSKTTRRAGGGAGGGCGGRGGNGNDLGVSNLQVTGAASTAGLTLQTITDPVSLF